MAADSILPFLSMITSRDPDPGTPRRPLAMTRSQSSVSRAIKALVMAGVLDRSAELVGRYKCCALGRLKRVRISFITFVFTVLRLGTTIFLAERMCFWSECNSSSVSPLLFPLLILGKRF